LCISPSHLSYTSTLPGKTQNSIVLLTCCITALPDFNQLLLDVLSVMLLLAAHTHVAV